MSTKGSVSFSTQNERLKKFVNYVMKAGKKTLAHKLINATFDILREKGYTNPEEVFDKAIDNVTPKIECRPKVVKISQYTSLKNLSMQPLKLVLRSKRNSTSTRWQKRIRHLHDTQITSSPLFSKNYNLNLTVWHIKKRWGRRPMVVTRKPKDLA